MYLKHDFQDLLRVKKVSFVIIIIYNIIIKNLSDPVECEYYSLIY